MSSSSCGVLPLTPMAPITLALDVERHAALKRCRSWQRQCCDAAVSNLILEDLARSSEDRRRPRLADADVHARDLCVVQSLEVQHVTAIVDDHDHHRGAALDRFGFGGARQRVFAASSVSTALRWELRAQSGTWSAIAPNKSATNFPNLMTSKLLLWKRRWPPLLGCSRFRFGYQRRRQIRSDIVVRLGEGRRARARLPSQRRHLDA